MNLGVSGIVINGFDQILLIQRDDTKTWALPAGSIEIGELPTEATEREVKEETGLKVMPVRLVALNFRQLGGRSFLQFIYRCLEAGGEITPSPETPQVGYFRTQHLPTQMLSISKEQIDQGSGHTGHAVWSEEPISLGLKLRWVWLKLFVYPRLARERKARGEPEHVSPPKFNISVAVAICDEANNLIWLKKDGKSQLPTSAAPDNKAPWHSAAEMAQAQTGRPVEISRLVAVYFAKDKTEMLILWEGKTEGSDGLTEIPADANPQSRRFAERALENNHLVLSDWL
ncbi:MAG: ADP-ribose pyrophosphatase YjhB (NUDIX family) [Candidatus Promineifilaceae bacterium]|jgi:ADP-ribose pyrophosphatase YjhB (NUDIX family)